VTAVAGDVPVGLVLGSALAPETLPALARQAEDAGFGELWFAEDYFFTGGISSAAAALSATERIPIGLGVVSAMVRHPALLAMEIATLDRMFPGRLHPGIGTGVPAWMRQMGVKPRSPLSALRESVGSVRRLLDGEEVSLDGRCFQLDRVRLTHPPRTRVPLYMGVLAPKAMQLSGEIADGNVLSVLASPAYVRWARERVAAGMREAGRDDERRMVTFAFVSVGPDGAAAKAALRKPMSFYLAADGGNALTDAAGISEELDAMLAGGDGAAAVEREMPAAWIDELAVAGEPDECAERIRRLLDAGSDSVVLFPVGDGDPADTVRAIADAVLPEVARA
jgi:alkanesulfonate monooxygenase SsuD/methylene tetrahydromethanopterin reductase-like flavin-dependent oxidoreductase (luciferase family)